MEYTAENKREIKDTINNITTLSLLAEDFCEGDPRRKAIDAAIDMACDIAFKKYFDGEEEPEVREYTYSTLTNFEYIKSMDIDEFTSWITKQLWPDITFESFVTRCHIVRNFLMDPYVDENG